MKKTYKIQGLDCANCALTLEKKLNKIEGVTSCQINFLSETMVIENSDESFEEIVNTCKNFEDGVSLKRIK